MCASKDCDPSVSCHHFYDHPLMGLGSEYTYGPEGDVSPENYLTHLSGAHLPIPFLTESSKPPKNLVILRVDDRNRCVRNPWILMVYLVIVCRGFHKWRYPFIILILDWDFP